MLIDNGDGRKIAGPADIIYIVELPTGRFHVVFSEERPLPGPVKPIEELEFIRLKSAAHHTTGAATLEEARGHVDEMRTKLIIPDANVVRDRAFKAENPVSVLFLENWVRRKVPVGEVLR